MKNTFVLDATLKDSQILKLSEPLPFSEGEVRVVVEVLRGVQSKQPLQDYLTELRERQTARGHSPRSKEEIDSVIRAGRDNLD